jgi:hypothetical protein
MARRNLVGPSLLTAHRPLLPVRCLWNWAGCGSKTIGLKSLLAPSHNWICEASCTRVVGGFDDGTLESDQK